MASPVVYQHKHALIIGINDYLRDPLQYCIHDAEDLGTTAQHIGFDVSLGMNCNLTEFYRKVDTFAETIQRDDLVLFYFAGHGKQKEDENYLLPSDYDYDHRGHERDYIINHAVNIKYIMKKIDDRRCRITIYLFDCCRHIVRTRAINSEQGLLPINAPLQTLIVFACAPGKAVQDETRNNRNGSFIESVLKYIATPNKDIEEIMKDVAYDVHSQTDGFQLPHRTSSLTSKVYLVTSNSQELNLRDTTERQQIIRKRQVGSSVSLTRSNLTDSDMKLVVEQVLINDRCEELHMGLNKISSIGASILAQALNNNSTLKSLWLYNNQVSDAGVYYFAETLSNKNNTLKELDLGKNEITDEGVKYLAQMIRTNTTLTQLYLHENKISDVGTRLLANAIQHHNTTIELLCLSSNKLLTDESVNPLVQMIQQNQSLQILGVSNCSLSERGKQRLFETEQLKQNFTLVQ